MKTVKVIRGQLVRELVMLEDLVKPMGEALVGFSARSVFQHPRVTVEPAKGDLVLLMPAGTADVMGLKVLTMYPRGVERGLPSVQGLVILMDAVTGEPMALLDGNSVTELRTAAVSAVATDALARADAATLAIIGAGVQGAAHLRALAGIRPWRDVRVYSRTAARAEAVVDAARAEGIVAAVAPSASSAVAGADVICTATSDCAPVIAAEDVAPGTHITAVGAFGPTCRELPTELVGRATLFADSREAVLAEAGDVLVPISEGVVDAAQVTEIGAVLAGRAPGRTGAGEVTVFKSLGLPIEDVVACGLIYERAVARSLGEDVAFD